MALESISDIIAQNDLSRVEGSSEKVIEHSEALLYLESLNERLPQHLQLNLVEKQTQRGMEYTFCSASGKEILYVTLDSIDDVKKLGEALYIWLTADGEWYWWPDVFISGDLYSRAIYRDTWLLTSEKIINEKEMAELLGSEWKKLQGHERRDIKNRVERIFVFLMRMRQIDKADWVLNGSICAWEGCKDELWGI